MARRRSADQLSLFSDAVDPVQSAFSADETGEAHPHPGPWFPMTSSRVQRARYDAGLNQVQCVFRDGTPWVYDGVPEYVWESFRTAPSPGKYINEVMNGFPYWHGAFDTDGDYA